MPREETGSKEEKRGEEQRGKEKRKERGEGGREKEGKEGRVEEEEGKGEREGSKRMRCWDTGPCSRPPWTLSPDRFGGLRVHENSFYLSLVWLCKATMQESFPTLIILPAKI